MDGNDPLRRPTTLLLRSNSALSSHSSHSGTLPQGFESQVSLKLEVLYAKCFNTTHENKLKKAKNGLKGITICRGTEAQLNGTSPGKFE